MAENFNRLQEEIGRAAAGLEGAREGLSRTHCELTETNERLRQAERKYAEEQLERLRNEHAVVLNSISEGVHWINLEGNVHYENPAGTKMLGYRTAELLGRPAHATMHHTRPDGTPHPQCECRIYATLGDGVVRHVEDDLFWRKDGSSFPVEYTVSPIVEQSGKKIGAVVVFTDITERKKAELELREMNKQLMEVSRQAGMAEVATSVLHNVGNVLNSVNISCTVISDRVRTSHIATLTKLAELVRGNAGDLASFFTNDPRGQKLPEFLGELAERLSAERLTVLNEIQLLNQNIDHIKEVVVGLRPQTLYGIVDSPVGLAAYFLDHDARSYALIARVFDGQSEGLTRDDILDNITITWLTNTALSGARLYWENKLGYFNTKGVSIPVAVSVFPDELYPAPRSWAERVYPKLIHYNKVEKGGHFAAWEQPQLFSAEVRAGFRSLR
jgi:PAS domain S-box-containing protein